MAPEALGMRTREPSDVVRRDEEQSGQAEPSELWQLPSREDREDDGREKIGGAEASPRDQRYTHQGLVSASLWLGQGGGEGGPQWKSMMMRTESLQSYKENKPNKQTNRATGKRITLYLYIPLNSLCAQLSTAPVLYIIYFQCTLPESCVQL